MRILHTAATYIPSLDGVAEVVRNISERLAQRGHEVHVATAAVGSASSSEELRGVCVHRFSARGSLAQGMKGNVERYREFVRSGNWDILVNHCVQTWPTDAVLGEIAMYPWPSILVTHGLSLDNPVFAEYYTKLPRYLSGYCKWIRVSELSEEALFAKNLNICAPTVITNGVDSSEWARPSLGLRRSWGIGRKPWVIDVSNHNPLKNHGDFFRLADTTRTLGAHFTLIGGSYPMSRWGLGRFGIAGGCAYPCRLRSNLSMGRVSLKTNIPRREVVSAIQEADVVVSASTREANSIVILESMAAGTPWVSFDVGSARRNAGGIVVRNLDEMSGAVGVLLSDPERRSALGKEGRERIAAKHDWERLTDQYEGVYASLVHGDVQACLH